MLTPQEIQDKKFEKAVFGGYDMGQIDKFLDEVLADYTSLYKENATLKAKMRVLVDKIEEYRAVDEEMRKALYTAQVTAKDITDKAKREADSLLSDARREADQRIASIRAETELEQRRLEEAKKTSQDYINKIKELMRRNIEIMDSVLDKPAEELKRQSKPSGKPAPRDDFEVVLPDEVTEATVPAAAPRESVADIRRLEVSFAEPETGEIAAFMSQADAARAKAQAVENESAIASAENEPGWEDETKAYVGARVAQVRPSSEMETQFFEVELGTPKPAAGAETNPEAESDTAKIYGDATFTPKPRFDFSDIRFGKDYSEDDDED